MYDSQAANPLASTPAKTTPWEYSKLLIIHHQMYHFLLPLWYRWVTITAVAVESHLGSAIWNVLTHPLCSGVIVFQDHNQRNPSMKSAHKAIILSITGCFTFVSTPRWVSDLLIVHVMCQWPCFVLSGRVLSTEKSNLFALASASVTLHWSICPSNSFGGEKNMAGHVFESDQRALKLIQEGICGGAVVVFDFIWHMKLTTLS